MPFYALSTVPLISKLTSSQARQVWYADDASAFGSIREVRAWSDDVNVCGPGFGYFPNAAKTWLIVKDSCYSLAASVFADTNVSVTSEGRPYLGSPLGTASFVSQFVEEKVEQWVGELKMLSDMALAHPHAAFAAFTHGLKVNGPICYS